MVFMALSWLASIRMRPSRRLWRESNRSWREASAPERPYWFIHDVTVLLLAVDGRSIFPFASGFSRSHG
jgi:hypothetical protein